MALLPADSGLNQKKGTQCCYFWCEFCIINEKFFQFSIENPRATKRIKKSFYFCFGLKIQFWKFCHSVSLDGCIMRRNRSSLLHMEPHRGHGSCPKGYAIYNKTHSLYSISYTFLVKVVGSCSILSRELKLIEICTY